MEQIQRLVDALGPAAGAMYALVLRRWIVSIPVLFLPAILSYAFWGVVIGSDKPLLRTIQTSMIFYGLMLSAVFIYTR
jgi:hypothetical protein